MKMDRKKRQLTDQAGRVEGSGREDKQRKHERKKERKQKSDKI